MRVDKAQLGIFEGEPGLGGKCMAPTLLLRNLCSSGGRIDGSLRLRSGGGGGGHSSGDVGISLKRLGSSIAADNHGIRHDLDSARGILHKCKAAIKAALDDSSFSIVGQRVLLVKLAVDRGKDSHDAGSDLDGEAVEAPEFLVGHVVSCGWQRVPDSKNLLLALGKTIHHLGVIAHTLHVARLGDVCVPKLTNTLKLLDTWSRGVDRERKCRLRGVKLLENAALISINLGKEAKTISVKYNQRQSRKLDLRSEELNNDGTVVANLAVALCRKRKNRTSGCVNCCAGILNWEDSVLILSYLDMRAINRNTIEHGELGVAANNFLPITWQIGDRVSSHNELLEGFEPILPAFDALEVFEDVVLQAEVLEVGKGDAQGRNRCDRRELVTAEVDRLDEFPLLLGSLKLLVCDRHKSREHLAGCGVKLEKSIQFQIRILPKLGEIQHLGLGVVSCAQNLLQNIDRLARAAVGRRSIVYCGVEELGHNICRNLDVDTSKLGLVPVEHSLQVRGGDVYDQVLSLFLGLSKRVALALISRRILLIGAQSIDV